MQSGKAGSFEERNERQRQRLTAAAMSAIAKKGYDGVSIADVCRLSGCSELTFHRHYDDLRSCLKDGCSLALDDTRVSTIGGWLEERGWRKRLEGACTALLSHAEDNREAAKAVLVESLKAGPPLNDHLRERIREFERVVTMAFQLHPEGFPSCRHTPRAVTGGVRHLIRTEIVEAAERVPISELAKEISDWICCYRAQSVGRLYTREPTREECIEILEMELLPKHLRWQQPDVEASLGDGEDGRILSALTHAALQEGREVLEDETLARFAGVEKERLTNIYGGVEGCMTGMVEVFLKRTGLAIRSEQDRAMDWPHSVRLGVVGMLRQLEIFPRFSRVSLLRRGLLPALAVSGEEAVRTHLLSQLLVGGPAPKHASRVLSDALTGALSELLAWTIEGGVPKKSKRLPDDIAFVLLAPYLGGEEAVEALVKAAASEGVDWDPRKIGWRG